MNQAAFRNVAIALALLPASPARGQAKPPPSAPPPAATAPGGFVSGFSFSSYGRVVAGGDLRGRPGRDTDFVARGSRLDESSYVELELRREDHWERTHSHTRIVTTLALGGPLFHYSGVFDATIAVRNLFIEERDLVIPRLGVWAGSRMLRGDDVYLLDFWPLDNLNTFGGGARYDLDERRWTSVALHVGVNRPGGLFFYQTSERTPPDSPFGPATVEILDRQRTIGSLKLAHIVPLGATGGLKGILYGEAHALSGGRREVAVEKLEDVPAESGFVLGLQVGAFSGVRDTHLNLFFRYARGLAAYGELGTPSHLSQARTTEGASELRLATGGNLEVGPFGLLLGGYLRSFRNASLELDADDIDEGCLLLRPHFFWREWGGLAVEASFQAQRRFLAVDKGQTEGEAAVPARALAGSMWRFGVIPFLSPAGRGDYSRPQLRFIYLVSLRDDAGRAFYPPDDVFGMRRIEHYLGFGAEWWFSGSPNAW